MRILTLEEVDVVSGAKSSFSYSFKTSYQSKSSTGSGSGGTKSSVKTKTACKIKYKSDDALNPAFLVGLCGIEAPPQ